MSKIVEIVHEIETKLHEKYNKEVSEMASKIISEIYTETQSCPNEMKSLIYYKLSNGILTTFSKKFLINTLKFEE